MGEQAKLHLYLQPLPIAQITTWAQENKLRFPLILHWDELYNCFHHVPQCNNNRNKVHNECVVLESSPNHHASQSMEKSSSLKLVPGAKKIGDHCSLYSNSRALSSFLGCMCLCSNFCALWRKNEKMRQKGEWRVRGEGGKDRREQTHIGRLDEDQIWRGSVYWIPALSTVESHLYLAGETEITIVCYICILVPIPSLRWARWLQ